MTHKHDLNWKDSRRKTLAIYIIKRKEKKLLNLANNGYLNSYSQILKLLSMEGQKIADGNKQGRNNEQRKYLVGLREGAQRRQITASKEYASRLQKAGMTQAICQSSLNGSVALKYS